MTYNWLNLARGKARSWMTSFGCVAPLLNDRTFFEPGPRHCHNSHILAHLSSAFTSWNQAQLFELFRRRNFRHGVAKAASNYIGTTPSRIFPRRMAYTPCWLRTSSSMHSRFISSKYAADICIIVRLTPSIFIEKSSRLERGLDYVYSRSSCQNYPETFRRRFLP
jgi:hypothetical protein